MDVQSSDVVSDAFVARSGESLSLREHGVFRVRCLDGAGNVKWEEDAQNALTNEGEEYFLNAALRATGGVSTFYIRLLNTGASPGASSTLASPGGTEASGTGYSAQSVTFGAPSKPGSHYQSASTQASWTAGASWTAVTYMYLATTSNNTGKHVAYAALSQSRTLATNDQLQITYTITQQ